MRKTFLQAEWRKLVMANYAVDRKILEPFLPYHTEMDLFQGVCYVSLIGFMFLNTKIKGIKIPFHIHFEEVNLRFYVRHQEKRGVVFIKEIVPKPALTLVANTIYGENYETMVMEHTWSVTDASISAEYRWKKERWHSLKIVTGKQSFKIADRSEEEFITEHYWGYTQIKKTVTSEYEVVHPAWEVYKTKEFYIDVDFGVIYGKQFEFLNHQQPLSVFLAEGSPIEVKAGGKIK